MESPKTLVTGANGYSGKMLCLYLAKKGIPTRGMYYAPDGAPDFSHENLELIPGDIRNRDQIKASLEGIEIVHHLAALYRPANVSNKDFEDVNVQGTRNMVELAAEAKIKRFVHCSTIGVHGHVVDQPGPETAPIKPDDYYQATKYEGEVVAKTLGPELGLDVAVIRPAAIYGPGERRFLKLAQLMKKGRFMMFGSGQVNYHWIHIDDLCWAFEKCAEAPEAVGQVYIIADEKAIQLNEVLRIFAKALNVQAPKMRWPLWMLTIPSTIVEFAYKPFGVNPPLHRRRCEWFWSSRAFDITKSRKELGYVPQVKTEEGLIDMVRSYEAAGWL